MPRKFRKKRHRVEHPHEHKETNLFAPTIYIHNVAVLVFDDEHKMLHTKDDKIEVSKNLIIYTLEKQIG